MKALVKIAIVSLLAVFSATSYAQSAATNATATILTTALRIFRGPGTFADLDFGDIIPGTLSSEVHIPAERTSFRALQSGDATLIPTNPGNAAYFYIYGLPSSAVSFSITNTSIILSDGSGNDMPAELIHNTDDPILDENGQALFFVGGTITVGVSQPIGLYTGSFEIIASYQ